MGMDKLGLIVVLVILASGIVTGIYMRMARQYKWPPHWQPYAANGQSSGLLGNRRASLRIRSNTMFRNITDGEINAADFRDKW